MQPLRRSSCHLRVQQNRKDKKVQKIQRAISLLVIGIFYHSFGHAATSSSWSSPSPSSWNSDSTGGNPGGNASVSRHSLRSTDLAAAGEVSPFAPSSNNLALDLGQVFLMGDIGGKYSDSLGTQFHYTYGVSDLLAFDSSLGYSEHSNGQYTMVTLLTGIRLNLSWYDKIIPYGVFGLGFYRPSYKNVVGNPTASSGQQTVPPGTDSSPSAILFGLHLGPGIDLVLNRNLFFGAAITFHNMFGSQQMLANGNTLNVGGAYTSFFLHLGTSF